MTVLLSCQSLTKSFSARPLFREITFGIDDNERLGLIGPNGSGKSTLLRIFAGLEKPDTGTVSTRRLLRLGYLPQEESFESGMTVEDVLRGALTSPGMDETERTVQVEIMLARVEFPQKDQRVETLSGGWRKRLAIARELIREPELLLMDEPTNHLDLEGVLWLERVLKEASFAYLLISHDRYFLEHVTNRIVELNPAYADGYLSVNGRYSDFLVKRSEYLEAQAHLEQALNSKVKREIEWLRRGAPARTTKAQARIDEAGRLIENLAEVKSRNSQGRTAGIDFSASGRKTRDLLVAKSIGKSLGGQALFSDLDLILSPGTRLGLLGPNGSGKTTLLRLLTGELEPDTGMIKRAEGLRIVSFDQNREQLDRSVSLRDALSPAGDTVVYGGSAMHVSSWAKRFLFRPEQLNMPLSIFSGGEQARVLIARLMLLPADLLILDEPTNDLDIPTLEILEESLLSFSGALVLVTHDRYLLEQVSTEILALEGASKTRYYADYAQWEAVQQRTQAAIPPQVVKSTAKSSSPPPTPANRMTSAERREWKQIEEKIEAAEEEVRLLQRQLETPEVVTNHLRLQECWDKLEIAKQSVTSLYERWEELEAKQG